MDQMLKDKKLHVNKISLIVGFIALIVAIVSGIDLFGPQNVNTGRILSQVNVLAIQLRVNKSPGSELKQNSVFVKLDKGIFNEQFVASDELASLIQQSNNSMPVTVFQTPILQTITALSVNDKTYYVAFRSEEMYLFGAMLFLGLILALISVIF